MKKSISLKSLDPVYEKLEKLTKVQRFLIFFLSLTILVGVFVYFAFLPKYTKIKELRAEHEKLVNDLAIATRKAARLPKLKKDLAAAEEKFKVAGQALPENEEIPSLLAGISTSGQDSGLEFDLFQPKPEVRKDFYAEIPVSITVQGNYHNVGQFFDKVSNLGRIVNIQDIKIKPISGSETAKLSTSCTALTYKFIEEKPAGARKGKPKKK